MNTELVPAMTLGRRAGLTRQALASFSAAFPSSHSASISSSVASSGVRPCSRRPLLDVAEAAFELGVGAAQRRFRIDLADSDTR